jgi:hypothetical protein
MSLKGEGESEFKGRLKIPFKNENIVAMREEDDGSETVRVSLLFLSNLQ